MPKALTNANKTWIPPFLYERNVRKFMQALYVAIVNSSDNARTLIESDPSLINYKTAKWNELAKSCMLEVSGWLARSKQFALSDDIYCKQSLEPAKHVAEYIIQIRNL